MISPLDLTCPGCGFEIAAVQKLNFHENNSNLFGYSIYQCPRGKCREVFFIKWNLLEIKTDNFIDSIFPFPKSSSEQIHAAVPELIRRDFAEGNLCLHAGAFKGAVTLFRRTMQRIAHENNATGDNLYNQIEDIFSKGLITKNLKNAAHEVRHFGNFGAHPRDDGLDDVSREDCVVIRTLMESFMEDLYIRPHETKLLTEKRNLTKD